jgi:hypothetical protein
MSYSLRRKEFNKYKMTSPLSIKEIMKFHKNMTNEYKSKPSNIIKIKCVFDGCDNAPNFICSRCCRFSYCCKHEENYCTKKYVSAGHYAQKIVHYKCLYCQCKQIHQEIKIEDDPPIGYMIASVQIKAFVAEKSNPSSSIHGLFNSALFDENFINEIKKFL